jgi:hypothetical protein
VCLRFAVRSVLALFGFALDLGIEFDETGITIL